MWGTAAILATIIIATKPIDIIWPQALVLYHHESIPFFAVPRLALIVSVVVVNVFLQYKITISNRKVKENERLGNEEEVKKSKKLLKEVQAQVKTTIAVFVVGGIDIIATILLSIVYVLIGILVEPDNYYIFQLLTQPLEACVLLSHPLLYGFYMKKIRRRIPLCTTCNCHRQWIIHRHNRVGVLRQQQRAAATNTTV